MITVNSAVESKRFRYQPMREGLWQEDVTHSYANWYEIRNIDEDEDVPAESPLFEPEPPVHTD